MRFGASASLRGLRGFRWVHSASYSPLERFRYFSHIRNCGRNNLCCRELKKSHCWARGWVWGRRVIGVGVGVSWGECSAILGPPGYRVGGVELNFSWIHQEVLVTGCADISGVKNPRPKISTACTPRVVVGGMGHPSGCSGDSRYGVAPIGINEHDLFGLHET